MVVPVVVVAMRLLSVLSSISPAWWWWCGSFGSVVVFVDDCGCGVVDVVCCVVEIVVWLCMVWYDGFGSGGGGMVWWDGVGIWVGVWFGGGDVDCGGDGVYVEMRDVACGGGGCVVVFYLHSLLSSISPAQPMLSIFPAES
jgi:hypothetical protein